MVLRWWWTVMWTSCTPATTRTTTMERRVHACHGCSDSSGWILFSLPACSYKCSRQMLAGLRPWSVCVCVWMVNQAQQVYYQGVFGLWLTFGLVTRHGQRLKQNKNRWKELKLWRFQMNPGDVRLHVLCVQNIKHIKHISGLKMCSGSPLEPCSLIHVWKCLFRPSSPYLVRAFHAALTTSRLRHIRLALSLPSSQHGTGKSGHLLPTLLFLSSTPSSFWFIPLNIMWTEVKLWL